MTIKYLTIGKQHILYPAELQPQVEAEIINSALFEPERLTVANKVYATAKGRGTSYFFNENNQQWILRHYWRGGLIGRYCKDSYWRTSIENTRPYLELQLLSKLQQLKLPAPEPVAGRLQYHGLAYRGDIVTRVIPDSVSLVSRLASPLPSGLWGKIGHTIALFHHHNIYHADLNTHNILIDKDENIFLIDFDKGRQMSSDKQTDKWKKDNLNRLLRSFKKELTKQSISEFDDQHWQSLLAGYRDFIKH